MKLRIINPTFLNRFKKYAESIHKGINANRRGLPRGRIPKIVKGRANPPPSNNEICTFNIGFLSLKYKNPPKIPKTDIKI